MSTYNLSPLFRQRFFDQNGLPLAGGQLFTYQAGTATPQVTYSNSTGTPNANPVILDAYGYCDVWLDPTLSYKMILKDSLGNIQWTVDQVSIPFFNLGWQANITYAQGQIVQDASGQGLLYVSLTNGNQGNALTDIAAWRLIGGNVRTLSTNTTLLVTDELVRSNSTSGNLTHTMPLISSTPIGKRIVIVDVGTGGNSTTFAGNGADVINNIPVLPQYGAACLENNGTSWDVIWVSGQPITAAQIPAGLITQAKLQTRVSGGTTATAGQIAVSASSGGFTSTSTSPTAVTNLSVTLTTTGRPVRVGLFSDGTGTQSFAGVTSAAGTVCTAFFSIYRAATILSNQLVAVEASNPGGPGLGVDVPPSSICHLDLVSAGTYTYSVKVAAGAVGSPTVQLENCILVAYEI